jgi:predicted MFS family arabinose efflux permease
MLLMLAAAMFFHQADSTIFAIMIEPIRKDLAFSDVQLGLLSGSAFALVYALLSIPIARIADRGARRNVIAACLALWSLFTALTALANSFSSLFAARLLVGIGEAGVAPAAMALIAAWYPVARRGGANAVLQSGRYVGIIVALWGAGKAIEHVGWRHTFLLFGIPGMLLAIALYFTLKEPRDKPAIQRTELLEGLRGLDQPVIRHIFLFFAFGSIVSNGLSAWAPAYYMRTYGLSTGDVGFWLGIAIGLGALIGALSGGFMSNRLPPDRPVIGLKLMFWTQLLSAPLSLMPFLVAGRGWSTSALLLSTIVGAFSVGTIYGTLQSLIDFRIRATALAFFGVGVAIVGMGIGPVLVGAMSDVFRELFKTDSLRWSLVIVTLLNFQCVFHVWRIVKLFPQARYPIDNEVRHS